MKKQSVSARWVANRVARGLQQNPNIKQERIFGLLGRMEKWKRYAGNKTLDKWEKMYQELPESPSRFRQFHSIQKELPNAIPRANYGVLPPNHSNFHFPGYQTLSRHILPGKHLITNLHEFGHHLDYLKNPRLRLRGGNDTTLREILANRQAATLRDQLADKGMANLPSASDLRKWRKLQLEHYRLQELNDPHSLWGPVRRMMKNLNNVSEVPLTSEKGRAAYRGAVSRIAKTMDDANRYNEYYTRQQGFGRIM